MWFFLPGSGPGSVLEKPWIRILKNACGSDAYHFPFKIKNSNSILQMNTRSASQNRNKTQRVLWQIYFCSNLLRDTRTYESYHKWASLLTLKDSKTGNTVSPLSDLY